MNKTNTPCKRCENDPPSAICGCDCHPPRNPLIVGKQYTAVFDKKLDGFILKEIKDNE